MTWDQLITLSEEWLRYHLAVRHLDGWDSGGEHRRQHYRGARTCIAHIREYRARKVSERSAA